MRCAGGTALLLALGALAALGLAACGAGGGGTSAASTGTSTNPSTPTATAPAATPKPSGSSAASEAAADRQGAGRAAPFVEPHADNSIPTFGSESSASGRGEAEAALKAYLPARAKGDWATACDYLAASTREGIEKLAASSKAKVSGCAPILAALSRGSNRTDPLTGSLLSLRVEKANAFALFYGPQRQRYIVPMRREAGGWKLTQTAPIAYPPGSPTQTPTSP